VQRGKMISADLRDEATVFRLVKGYAPVPDTASGSYIKDLCFCIFFIAQAQKSCLDTTMRVK